MAATADLTVIMELRESETPRRPARKQEGNRRFFTVLSTDAAGVTNKHTAFTQADIQILKLKKK